MRYSKLKSSLADLIKKAKLHVLEADSETVHWGHWDNSLAPVLTVESGDFVFVETITHQAGDAPELMMDETTKEIYRNIPEETRKPGPHLLTGPIEVKGAEPGDMLEVQILDIEPRQPYGSNLSAPWGFLFDKEKYEENEHVMIYELDDHAQWLTQKYKYEYPGAYDVNGRVVGEDEITKEEGPRGMRIPAQLHMGTIGVAPEEDGKISTVPPSNFGGNIDNWRIGADTAMYYPVFNKGALLSLGDAHLAQGDSELNGTGVEASANCLIRVKVRKDFHFTQPLLETEEAWHIHAFNENLDDAAEEASLKAIEFLEEYQGMTEQEAYSFLALAGELQITQVVNTNKGVHVTIPKDAFVPEV
ncbi:formamidase [Salinicoccus kekensis]|uniref:Formamidase n=1 Tax=Salinicoccus kekensis TaxID=714307 RepID=A0A285U909_9STAP|nr:formamidase [Salinicoccus kekensis]